MPELILAAVFVGLLLLCSGLAMVAGRRVSRLPPGGVSGSAVGDDGPVDDDFTMYGMDEVREYR